MSTVELQKSLGIGRAKASDVDVTLDSPIESFIRHVSAALESRRFVRLQLSQSTVAATPVDRVIARLVDIRGQENLSLTLREPTRDVTRNLALAEVAPWLEAEVPARFLSAVLETTEKSWQLSPTSRGELRLAAHRSANAAPPSRKHDIVKPRALDTDAKPWLVQLGIMDVDGRVRASMADKNRQLERYLEIFTHLVRDCGWCTGDELAIADMGSGKGHLTFGVWHLLNKTLGLSASVLGVETRVELVDKTNAVARASGAETLRFLAGTIADVALPGRLDALIALHACNTATDDAIRRGIALDAKLIVVSPCCHQELRPQLGKPEPLTPLLEHGIFAERMSEWLTDGLRALHLEAAGYVTKVIEFVGSEHTPRNLLIAGIRPKKPDEAARRKAAADITRLKDFFGIKHQALDPVLPRPVKL